MFLRHHRQGALRVRRSSNTSGDYTSARPSTPGRLHGLPDAARPSPGTSRACCTGPRRRLRAAFPMSTPGAVKGIAWRAPRFHPQLSGCRRHELLQAHHARVLRRSRDRGCARRRCRCMCSPPTSSTDRSTHSCAIAVDNLRLIERHPARRDTRSSIDALAGRTLRQQLFESGPAASGPMRLAQRLELTQPSARISRHRQHRGTVLFRSAPRT